MRLDLLTHVLMTQHLVLNNTTCSSGTRFLGRNVICCHLSTVKMCFAPLHLFTEVAFVLGRVFTHIQHFTAFHA